jgi:prophage regulatory protein
LINLDQEKNHMRKILSPEDVVQVTNLSRPTFTRMEQRGDFPHRVQISDCRVGWFSDEIAEWIDARPRAAQPGKQIPKEATNA